MPAHTQEMLNILFFGVRASAIKKHTFFGARAPANQKWAARNALSYPFCSRDNTKTVHTVEDEVERPNQEALCF